MTKEQQHKTGRKQRGTQRNKNRTVRGQVIYLTRMGTVLFREHHLLSWREGIPLARGAEFRPVGPGSLVDRQQNQIRQELETSAGSKCMEV